MALPIQTQLFDAFLGTQEGVHSIILPDIFSSGGSKNVYMDKYARVKRILGYIKQNSTAVTTDTGGSTTVCRALYPYRKTSGGSTTRQLIGVFDDGTDEWEIWKSTDDGATWTFVADLGATVVGQIPDFAQQGDTLIITSGKAAPRSWNGTSLVTAGATQSPQPSSSATGTGVLLGNYKWKLVSVNGSGTRKAGSLASTVLAIQNQQGSLTWTADADTSQVGYELYRTTGTGEVYYFVTFISGRTTVAYTDNTYDVTILENRILEESGDAPPTTYFCEPHKQRMWYFRTDSEPQAGYWSDPGLPDSVLITNKLTFSDASTQGDVIVGATGDYEGQLVVWEERSIWTVSGTGEVIGNIEDWTRSRTNAQTGTVHHRTVARIPAGSKYSDQEGQTQITKVSSLAYLTPLNDIRLFDGDNDIIISHPVKTLLSTLNFTARTKSHCLHDPSRTEVTWFYPSGSSGEPSTAVSWNYKWGVWYQREWAFSCAVEMDTASTASLLLAGSGTAGRVYQLWSGNAFDGSNFTAQWMTKTLWGVNEQSQPALSNRKRWRWADFLFETDNSVTLTLEWLQGNVPDNATAIGSTTFSPATGTILSFDGSTLTSADASTVVLSANSTLDRVQFKTSSGDYLYDRGIRLRIYDAAQAGSWSLESMQLAYQIMPGLKRTVGV